MQTLAGGESSKGVRGDMAFESITTESGAILYDPSRISHPTDEDFEPASLKAAGRITATAAGRGQAWFLSPRTAREAPTVLRHFRRGGLMARWLGDRYVWCGAARTRCVAELNLLARLEQLELPAARPVAVRYRREGLWYRADLLTELLADVRSLAACLPVGLARAQWWQIGHTLRRFHDAGICHADLNAHNILLDQRGGVHLVDFDRGRERSPGPWARANLQRLKRSLLKLGADRDAAGWRRDWEALETGYATPRGAPRR